MHEISQPPRIGEEDAERVPFLARVPGLFQQFALHLVERLTRPVMDAARQLDQGLPGAVSIFLDQDDPAIVRDRDGGDPVGLLDDVEGREYAAIGQFDRVGSQRQPAVAIIVLGLEHLPRCDLVFHRQRAPFTRV